MRFVIVLALLATLSACGPDYNISFVNKSDTDLCWYESEAHIGDASWCGHVGATQTKVYLGGPCNGTDRKLVLLTVGLSGDVVYRRDATCAQWGANIVTITGTKGALDITDGIEESSPSPN
jgi:hypothetical protein